MYSLCVQSSRRWFSWRAPPGRFAAGSSGSSRTRKKFWALAKMEECPRAFAGREVEIAKLRRSYDILYCLMVAFHEEGLVAVRHKDTQSQHNEGARVDGLGSLSPPQFHSRSGWAHAWLFHVPGGKKLAPVFNLAASWG
jgi:hypothetical protein